MTERRNCDLLAAYELNILEEAERRLFETHLPDCPDCLEELFAHAPVVTELLREPGLYAGRMTRPQSDPSLWNRLAAIFRRQPARVVAPLLVAALLAFVVFLPRNEASPFPGLARTDAPAYSVIPVRSGATADWQPLWQEGMLLYVAEEFAAAAARLEQAVPLLEQAVAADPHQRRHLDNARFYLGASRMLTGDADAAVPPLEAAATSHLPPVRQKSLWYLAQVHLLQDDPDGALAVLAPLESSPVYGPRARDQVAAIRSAR